MPEDNFYFNTQRRMEDIGVQVKHASQKGISNQAKSGYYRFAILSACTIAEGLLHKIIKKYLEKNNKNMGFSIVYKNPHNIPEKYLNEKSVICIQEKIEIKISNQTKFSELIKFANKNKIINQNKKTALEKTMRLRNRIHLQSLEGRDNGYTKKKLDEIFQIINFLIMIDNK